MTDEHTAFALAPQYQGSHTHDNGGPDGAERELDQPVPIFQGGVLALPPDGQSYDVADQLTRGDGVIVVSTANVPLVEMLRDYPALTEVAVPEGRTDDELATRTLPMLQDLARDLEISPRGPKPDLIARIQARRAELAGAPPGDTETDDEQEG